MIEYLDDKLREYCESDAYPFHMPGHKRSDQVLRGRAIEDITEIHGFDDLYHADGILKDAQMRAAALYGAAESLYLVNGSTVGILTSIFASCEEGSEILVARNCHRSVYHAALLRSLRVRFVLPEQTSYGFCGSLSPQAVTQALDTYPNVKALVLTSPTYEGIVSDIEAIAQLTRKAGILLIVDEAHGAHFGIGEAPGSAAGFADYTIQSMHKTLPCYTQTALLHCRSHALAQKASFYLRMLQTSSPSYLFMAGMDECIRKMSLEGKALLEKMYQRLDTFYRRVSSLECVQVISPDQLSREPVYAFDCSRITIFAAGMTGNEISSYLREEEQLELEMANEKYALAIVTMMDREEGFARLEAALVRLDRELTAAKLNQKADAVVQMRLPERVMELKEASFAEQKVTALEESAGKISAEFVYLYPPGIPVIVPGEVLTEELIVQVKRWQKMGLSIQGMEDPEAMSIKTVMRRT